jgi:hypothetical protein
LQAEPGQVCLGVVELPLDILDKLFVHVRSALIHAERVQVRLEIVNLPLPVVHGLGCFGLVRGVKHPCLPPQQEKGQTKPEHP